MKKTRHRLFLIMALRYSKNNNEKIPLTDPQQPFRLADFDFFILLEGSIKTNGRDY
jgi:hypothetical protein